MKRTMIELGYYHPSDANWSYHVHMIIDDTGARLYKETFGGDARIRDFFEAKGEKIEQLYAGVGTDVVHKWVDIKRMPNIESYTGINWGEGSVTIV